MNGLQVAMMRARICPRPVDNAASKSDEITAILVRLSALEAKLSTLVKQPWEGKCLDCGQNFETKRSGGSARCGECVKPHVVARTAAYAAFNRALKTGTLVRQACEVCGDPKAEGHHDDYGKPLDVRWLCRSHHGQVHSEQYKKCEIEVNNFPHELTRLEEAEPPRPIRPSIAKIKSVVCAAYNVTPNDLESEQRGQKIVWPRQIAVYLACRLTTKNLTTIGKQFGNRDHTTIIHSRNKVGELRAADEDVRNQLVALEAALA